MAQKGFRLNREQGGKALLHLGLWQLPFEPTVNLALVYIELPDHVGWREVPLLHPLGNIMTTYRALVLVNLSDLFHGADFTKALVGGRRQKMRRPGFTSVAKNATNSDMSTKEPFFTLRKNARLNIEATAKLFGVDRTTIIRWEKGEPRIPVKRLDEAARILGVSKMEIRPDIFEGVN